MLQALARFAIAAPKRVIVAALLMMVAAGVFAIPVMDSLSAGGMRNSTSQSWYASKILADKFDQGDMQLIVSVSSDAGAQGVSARQVATDLVTRLERFPFVIHYVDLHNTIWILAFAHTSRKPGYWRRRL